MRLKYFTHSECNASFEVTDNHPANTFIILLHVKTQNT